MTTLGHIPVLVEEVMNLFAPASGESLLDTTVGHGGHAQVYLEKTAPAGRVVGIDADPAALKVAADVLAKYGDRVQLVNANFSQLNDAIKWGGMVEQGESSLTNVPSDVRLVPRSSSSEVGFSHILFDLGLGSHQLNDPERSFSFTSGGVLSMAYGTLTKLPPAGVGALNALAYHLGYFPDVADMLAGLRTADLAEVIRVYGEERFADRVAHALKKSLPLTSAQAMAHVIADALPAPYERGRIHPATRTFQALRLAVNRELEALEATLPQAVELLKAGGALAVISFHSLEDRIVKNFFRSHRANLEILTKKPTQASEAEIKQNPRARSAKLRAAKKKVGSE